MRAAVVFEYNRDSRMERCSRILKLEGEQGEILLRFRLLPHVHTGRCSMDGRSTCWTAVS